MKDIWDSYKFGYWLAGVNVFLAIVLAALGNILWVFNLLAGLLCYYTAEDLKGGGDGHTDL